MKTKWFIILIAALSGVVLMGLGFAMGAKTDAGVYIDEDGLHFGGDDDMIELIKENFTSISSLDIDTRSANIEIIISDRFGLEIENRTNSEITWAYEGGNLRIYQKSRFFISLLSFSFKNDTVKVYIPRGGELDYVNIKSSSGKTTVGKINCGSFVFKNSSGSFRAEYIEADIIELDCSSGNITLDGADCGELRVESSSGSIKVYDTRAENISLTATSGRIEINDSSAGRFYAKLSSGNLYANSITTNNLEAKLTSGNANLNGKITGEIKVNVSSGSVKMDIEGKSSDYYRDLHSSSGSIYINGSRDKGDVPNYPQAANKIYARVTSGNVRINFN